MLMLAVAPVASSVRAAAPPLEFPRLSQLTVRPITVLPLNSPPINGFVPQVVFGLTDEQDPDSLTWAANPSTTPGGNGANTSNTLPVGSTAHYGIAILDSGSQTHFIT